MARDWTTSSIPDQTGRVAVITGANSGLGLETARELARRGATVVLGVRNLDKGKAAVGDIEASVPGGRLHLTELDLASLTSIRRAAADIASSHPRIDLVVNNAGVMYPPYQRTVDGFELQMGTNHLGHFALTGLLLHRMLEVEGSRVVTVSSQGHRVLSKIDLARLHSAEGYRRVAAYGRSKLANLLFTYELQRRFDAAGAATAALAAHPGGSNTELMRHLPRARVVRLLADMLTQSPVMGALPTLRAATDPQAGGGEYYGPDGFLEMRGYPVRVGSSRRARNVELQHALWQVSERETNLTYPI